MAESPVAAVGCGGEEGDGEGGGGGDNGTNGDGAQCEEGRKRTTRSVRYKTRTREGWWWCEGCDVIENKKADQEHVTGQRREDDKLGRMHSTYRTRSSRRIGPSSGLPAAPSEART